MIGHFPLSAVLCALSLLLGAQSHMMINYPGSRGWNLVTNGTVADTDGLSMGVAPGTNDPVYPYGMQWQFPCGGLPIAQNRTNWPVTGGPLAVQPGLQARHSEAMMWVNLGLGTVPANYSLIMVPVFRITGPSNEEYHDGFCLSHVPLPQGVTVNPGDNATIQVIETAKQGASLYTCVDITFVDSSQTPSLDSIGCTNSSSIGFSTVSWEDNSSWAWYRSGQTIGLGLGLGLPLVIAVAVLSYFLWKARKQIKTHKRLSG
ncbi:uncharacterized protein JN550_010742 [Neoarthrinium moseri]|uniref:uncharacterized protein n=1 Tax=Neoarthrinium moseri TaxID=1658444 RepID=UPI001FDCA2B9|nr:uncharacterized protein JN550_010742 [Neoarthrinium moseri]KAI1861672.1 hypothetical protein JN550_010742 [Neoarthrinium moseri]